MRQEDIDLGWVIARLGLYVLPLLQNVGVTHWSLFTMTNAFT
jgi:hypothetical protein